MRAFTFTPCFLQRSLQHTVLGEYLDLFLIQSLSDVENDQKPFQSKLLNIAMAPVLKCEADLELRIR